MRRRDFLKFGSAGLVGLTFGGLTRTPIFKIGKAFAQSGSSPWSFGVMGDTQWTTPGYADPSGLNPNSVAASIIDQVNAQFINLGVKFVIEVGDLTDEGTDAGIVTRAQHCQGLYNAGIGFFPIRGNHETYGGEYGPLNNYAIPAIQANFPQTQGLTSFNGGPSVPQSPWDAYNFSSATDSSGSPISDLQGIAYSFDYGASGNNARFLMLDFWATSNSNPQSTSAPTGTVNSDGYSYGYTVAQQQTWISNQLNSLTRGTEHAFVFVDRLILTTLLVEESGQ
ncbi:MAG TPA: metallophosphoesterase [Syntrophobacteraceae bacterium]|nr:metallophosphoesterase [Syntrophobacteraceae bacterium]